MTKTSLPLSEYNKQTNKKQTEKGNIHFLQTRKICGSRAKNSRFGPYDR